jgi:hypothetical protein
MSEITKQSLGSFLEKSECYLGNLSELSGELQEVAVEDDGSVVSIQGPQDVVAIMQVLWNKFKETAAECEGKTIEVKLPDTWTGMIINAALAAIGFKL